MIHSFQDSETEKIFLGKFSKEIDISIQTIARRKLRMIAAAGNINDLRIPPGNHLEKMHSELPNQYSIRINDQYRIIFLWNEGAYNVQIIDYHK